MRTRHHSAKRWLSLGSAALLASGLAVGGFALPATAAPVSGTYEEIPLNAPLPSAEQSDVVDEDLGMTPRADGNDIVNIPDPVLRERVVAQVRPKDPNAITVNEMLKFNTLKVKGWSDKIADLTGLEHAPNLQLFDISGHDVTSLEPLRNLTRLGEVYLNNLPGLTDISPLANSTQMTKLEINYTAVDSIEAVRGSTKLNWLQLGGTKVTSLDPLTGMESLYDLNFQETDISDLEPLRGLPSLGSIGALSAKIESIEPLTGLQELELLNINRNKVSDLTPIETMPALRQVGFQLQVVDGPAVQVPEGAVEYTKVDIADSFAMAYDERQQVTNLVDEILPDGEGGIWRGLDDSTDSVQAFVSKRIVPGGPIFSATITYPIERSEFTNVAPEQPRLDTEYSFAFTTTPGFIDYSALGTDANLFTLLSGEIPGLTLGADGVLAGTPTELGSFEITVRATDKHGNVIDQTYTIVVGEKIIDVDPPIVDPTDPPVDPPVKPVPPVKPAPDLAETGSTLAPFFASVAGLALLTGVVALLLGRRTKRN